MTAESFLVAVSVVISSLILAVGLWLLTGWYLDDLWPANVRYTAGTVMSLYGLHRIFTSRSRFKAVGERERGDTQDDGPTS